MNKFRSALLLTLMALFLVTNGCKKDTEDPIVEDTSSSVTVFTNQTGEPNSSANGLQAQVIDYRGNILDFYGNFNEQAGPDELQSIRVTRPDSDTIVNLILDQTTSNLNRAIFEVNGEKLDLVVEFDFPAGDTTMILSHYDYDWDTGESELYYAGEYYLSGGLVDENPIFVRQVEPSDWIAAGVGVGVGVAIAEVAVATGVIAGASLVGTALGAVVAGVAAVSSTVIITTALVGGALISISNANSSELIPQNNPVPTGTPAGNTSNQEVPDPLPVNTCITNGVNVTVGAEQDGSLTAIATGGTGQYTYNWSNGTTVTTGSSFHNIQPATPGTYSVVVRDENNCTGSGSATTEEQGLTTSEKLAQWGPWRSQIQDEDNEGEGSWYEEYTFNSSGDCLCISTQMFQDEDDDGLYDLDQSNSVSNYCVFTVINGGNTLGAYDSCPWDGDPYLEVENQWQILTLTESSLVISWIADGQTIVTNFYPI